MSSSNLNTTFNNKYVNYVMFYLQLKQYIYKFPI
jgi:hypothetical protein